MTLTWDYRRFHRVVNGKHERSIREAYYDLGKDVPHSWTAEPVRWRETIEWRDLWLRLRAYRKPVIELTSDGEHLA